MHELADDRLSDYLDGELSAAEAAQVESHLAACAECRATLGQLRQIVSAAATLPGRAPASDLWPGVAARLSARGGAARRISFTLPQLAAAAVLLMVVSAGMALLLRPAAAPERTTVDSTGPFATGVVPASLADPSFDAAVADLERTLEEGRGRLDPETVRVLEQNLATIDTAIEQSRRALEADPANTFLNSHLVSARQRKLALLRRATALTTGS